MKKASKVLQKRRDALKSEEEALWKSFYDEKDKIGKRFDVSTKKLVIALAGTLGGFVAFKVMTGGFKSSQNNPASSKRKKSTTTIKIVEKVVGTLLPILIKKFDLST